VRGLKHKNVAAELLEKLLKDELKVRSKRNLVQSQVFSEKLKKTLNAYHNRAISTMQVIEELIKLAKDLDAATKRGEDLGLTDDEVAFYDALAANDIRGAGHGRRQAQGHRRRADHPGAQERDHRLDPARRRAGEDPRDGETHPEQVRLPAGPCRTKPSRPCSRRRSCSTTLSSVLLPEPDGPISATNSPRPMTKETPCSTSASLGIPRL
jgi:hypothetical protein